MKYKFLIKGLAGEKKLKGEISVRGAKNAVLPVMAGALLFEDQVTLTNVPEIEDVVRVQELFNKLGVKIEKGREREIKINSQTLATKDLDQEISKRLRASVIMTGPILARFGEVSFPHPGGCVIGARPIDLFIEGYEKMGATVEERDGRYYIKAKGGKLKGANIFFRVQSVTGTENFLMAGVLAEGKTVLRNCALEPEIKSLADFLNSCGAKITGAGTPTIEIEGGNLLKAKSVYTTIPDRIEAGSFLILGALSAEDLTIKNCNPKDLESLIEFLRYSGVSIETTENSIHIKNNGNTKSENWKPLSIKTHEYPGFPTDLQAPMVVFLTQVGGESSVFETIFEGRLNYTQDLVKMGANIQMFDTQRAIVKGPTELKGKEVEGPDIRAGLALLIATIIASGDSVINNVYYIDRGYERIEERLRALGVDIIREEVAE